MDEAHEISVQVAIVEGNTATLYNRLAGLKLDGFAFLQVVDVDSLFPRLLTETFDIVLFGNDVSCRSMRTLACRLRMRCPALSIAVVGDIRCAIPPGEGQSERTTLFASVTTDFALILAWLLERQRELRYALCGTEPWQVALARGKWRLNSSTHALTAPNGTEFDLSPSQYAVLSTLMNAYGEVIPRARLLQALHAASCGLNVRRPDSIINRLRQKTINSCGQTLPLLTVRHGGYVFSMDRMPE